MSKSENITNKSQHATDEKIEKSHHGMEKHQQSIDRAPQPMQSATKHASKQQETGQHGRESATKHQHSIDTGQHGRDSATKHTSKHQHSMDTGQHGRDSATKHTSKHQHSMDTGQHGRDSATKHTSKHQHSMDTGQHGRDSSTKRTSKHHHHIRPKSISLPISNPDYDLVKSIYPFTMVDLNGHGVNLGKYEGHVCILVNVASKSAFAEHNYKVLNKLYEKYADTLGLRILAFPCDQFNHTEYTSNKDIKRFIDKKGVKFDVFSKISINCKNTHPLWRFMKTKIENLSNKWKLALITDPFTKFVVSRSGVPTARLNPGASEEDIFDALEPLFESGHKIVTKTAFPVENLPPPIEKKILPCMRSWHFEPGILTLI